MPTLPPPNIFDSGATDCPSDEAAANPRQSDLAAADICEPATSTGGCQEAPASTSTVTVAAGDAGATDCIGEIFAGARKLDVLDAEYLFDLDAGKPRHPNPRLDVAAFMQELDEAPLFLRQAVG